MTSPGVALVSYKENTESGNMRLLESEAIDMAIEELRREITIVEA
jgi:hypothetical protein